MSWHESSLRSIRVLASAFLLLSLISQASVSAGPKHAFSLSPVRMTNTSEIGRIIDVTALNGVGDFGGIHERDGEIRGFVVIGDAWFDYMLTDATETYITGLNNNGDVLGYGILADGTPQAFYIPGGSGKIGNVDGWASSLAHDGSFAATRNDGRAIRVRQDETDPLWLRPLSASGGAVVRGLSRRDGTYMVGDALEGPIGGYRHAVVWDELGRPFDLTPNTRANTQAVAVNNDGMIMGWIQTPNGADPTVWLPLEVESDRYEMVRGGGGSDLGLPRDINDAGEVLLDSGLWIPSDPANGIEHFVPVTAMANRPRDWDPKGRIQLRRINNSGMMIGVVASKTGPGQVVRIVPHDSDNNEIADYRDIVRGALDLNEDWVLDRSQWMRNGFFNASTDRTTLVQYRPIQVVRVIRDVSNIRQILNNRDAAIAFNELLDLWGCERRAEIIVTIRTAVPIEEGDYDFVPMGATREAILEDLREFASLYSVSIDYIQLGNEVFGGAGGFVLEEGSIECDGFNGGTAKEVPGPCLPEALDLVFDWLEDMAHALREGAAISPRPIRIIGPALNRLHVQNGADGDPFDFDNMRPIADPRSTMIDVQNRAAFVSQAAIQFANHVCDFIDLHGRYYEDEMEIINAAELIQSPDTSWGRLGWLPEAVVVTEYAPMPRPEPQSLGESPTWWQLHTWSPDEGGIAPTLETYIEGYEGPLPPPTLDWNEFVTDWRTTETTLDEDFGLPRVLKRFAESGVVIACYAPLVQYGPSEPGEILVFNMSAAYANFIDPAYLTTTRADTVLHHAYERAAIPFEIPGFNPHPGICPFLGP